jgi:Ca-activated chloride channel family protein
MTFASPTVLIALLAVPVAVIWYVAQQRGRSRAAQAFAVPALTPSVAPRRPRWRRHLPMLAFLLALAVLILAAARPQRSVAVPLNDGAIMLANDVSDSMDATDVKPDRLIAAESAARHFVSKVPAGIQVGLLEFSSKPVVLQSPSTDHALTETALGQLRRSGGTAIGEAIETALNSLAAVPKHNGKRTPGAILLISDGASNVGVSPLVAARKAAAQHVPVYTIALGTANGIQTNTEHGHTVSGPAPPDPTQLAEVSKLSGGRAFTAADEGKLSAVYDHLAAQFGRKKTKQEMTASFAGGAMVLLLIGSALSLRWFGRLV